MRRMKEMEKLRRKTQTMRKTARMRRIKKRAKGRAGGEELRPSDGQ